MKTHNTFRDCRVPFFRQPFFEIAEPYMSVPPQKVGFLSRLGLKTGISFAHFGLKLGMGFKRSRTLHESIHGFNSKWGRKKASSETQGQSVGSGEKVGRKFSSTGERPAGYRLSSNYFQKFKRMPAPDWAQKMLCIIVPNRRTVSPEFFSWVRTRRLLSRSRLVWLMHQRNARSQETFSLI